MSEYSNAPKTPYSIPYNEDPAIPGTLQPQPSISGNLYKIINLPCPRQPYPAAPLPVFKEKVPKRAHLISTVEPGLGDDLKVTFMKDFLISNCGYVAENVQIILGATHANILEAFKKIDLCSFLYYSGPATCQVNESGDDVIVPVDYKENGVIGDELLFKEVFAKLDVADGLRIIYDAPNSKGTFADLPLKYRVTRENYFKTSNSTSVPEPLTKQVGKISKSLFRIGKYTLSNMMHHQQSSPPSNFSPTFSNQHVLKAKNSANSAYGEGVKGEVIVFQCVGKENALIKSMNSMNIKGEDLGVINELKGKGDGVDSDVNLSSISESLGVLGGILDLKNQTVHYSALLSGLSDLIPDILQISSSRILSFAKKEFAL